MADKEARPEGSQDGQSQDGRTATPTPVPSKNPGVEVEAGEETDAVFLDTGAAQVEGGNRTDLKLAPDGHTVLIPQPSDDPNDPLNWSSAKKNWMLAVVSMTAILGDYGSGAGIPLIVLQGREWKMSPEKVNENNTLNVLMLGIGGLFWIILSTWWGRAPVMFWSTFTGIFFTLGAVLAPTFEAYYACRAMMGFTLTAYQVVGLACVKDMFFFHEHARKIGIWVATIILSPYLGPFLANFIIAGTHQWRPVIWLVLAMCCADLIFIILICDETYYNRDVPYEQQPVRPQTVAGRLSRMVGIWQMQNHKGYFMTCWHCCSRLLSTFLKPIMLLAMIYFAMSFMWAVGINITSTILLQMPIRVGGYGFGPKSVGFLYFTPLVAVTLGEGFGHFFNDWVAARYVRKHKGIFKPEARLITNYIGAACMIPGLIIVGQTLQHRLHYAGIIMGWGLYVFGVMLSAVTMTAYTLDSYGSASSEVAGLLNFARILSGFAVGYFQQPWGHRSSYALSFGMQSVIVFVAISIIVVLQVYGSRLRTKGGAIA